MGEFLVLEKNALAFLAGVQEGGVVADLDGSVVVVELGVDQLAFDLDRLGRVCLLDGSDNTDLNLGWDGRCLSPDHVSDLSRKFREEGHGGGSWS
jgi:hypothetical protein